jgi:glycogen debranching enzyme
MLRSVKPDEISPSGSPRPFSPVQSCTSAGLLLHPQHRNTSCAQDYPPEARLAAAGRAPILLGTTAAARLRDAPTTARLVDPARTMSSFSPPHRFHALSPHDPWQVAFGGYTVLVTRQDGRLVGEQREGLYDFDIRLLSRHRLTIGGQEPVWISGAVLESDRWTATLLLPRHGGMPEGPALPQDGAELVMTRRVGRGMEEQWMLRNHSMVALETELVLELDADFADSQEVTGERQQQGDTEVVWDAGTRTLLFLYRVTHQERALSRALSVHVETEEADLAREEKRLRFFLRLPPRGEWNARLTFASLVDGEWRQPLPEDAEGNTERDRFREEWRTQRPRIEAALSALGVAWERAAEDLWALRNWELDPEPGAWVPNAGVPTYTGFFGRDALTSAWQAALLGPEMLRGALAIAARTQATEDSAWRDAEPGKMIHEMRRGPLSELEIIPQRAYYGTVTTPAMFLLALSELWHWTGDTDALRRYRDAALRTFDWVEQYGDRDGDGFIEYDRRSPKGLKNHAWKDSDEAIRYPDGSLVPNPIATCEEQAYHLIALQRMAEILLALEEDERAEEFLARARSLARRWHEGFWFEDEGFYALALYPEKRPVRSIASNAGHALGAGIVPPEVARRVADRLMEPDLFSGWGIRTLSAEHPSYNPWAYHLGTVWPVENATFAIGFKRYGLEDHFERLVGGLFAAAAHFRDSRLPEALAGHGRGLTPLPSAYPRSNSPQAWSAGAVVQLVQAMLGIYPFAPANLLALVRPRLPDWLPELTLRNLRVGEARISLYFRRDADGGTSHEILDHEGTLRVVNVAPPNDLSGEATRLERLKEWVLEHAPGRSARALRIALGDLES